jgi:hypothetical protein
MDSDTVKNVAKAEVQHGTGPSNTNNLSSTLREQYESERVYQEKLKQQQKSGS